MKRIRRQLRESPRGEDWVRCGTWSLGSSGCKRTWLIGALELCRVRGDTNLAGALITRVGREILEQHMEETNQRVAKGRHVLMPRIDWGVGGGGGAALGPSGIDGRAAGNNLGNSGRGTLRIVGLYF